MVHVHTCQYGSNRQRVGYVGLTGSTRLAVVRLFGIKVGAFYVVDPLAGQVACENIFEASKRLSLVM